MRISLLSAGAWWGLFTLVPLRTLRDPPPPDPVDRRGSALSAGWRQLRATAREARSFPETLKFLGAYLLYNDGIQTVIALAAV